MNATTTPADSENVDERYSADELDAIKSKACGFGFLAGLLSGLFIIGFSSSKPDGPVKRYEFDGHRWRLEALERDLQMKAAYEAGRDGKEMPYGPTS